MLNVFTYVNTLRPRQNGRHFTDVIFNCVFWNENVWISIDILLKLVPRDQINHYDDVIMCAIASQIASLMIVYSTVYPGADQSKHQSSASLAFVWGIHRGPVNSPHKWPVTRKMFPFDDVIMQFPALVQIMAWRRLGDKPLSKAMLVSLLTQICITRWVNIVYLVEF